MANDKHRLDPAGPLRGPEQTLTDHDERTLVQYRWRQYKIDSNALTATAAETES